METLESLYGLERKEVKLERVKTKSGKWLEVFPNPKPPKEEKLSFSRLAPLLRERRGGKDLRETSSEVGVSISTLSRVENGRTPSLKDFSKICGWLQVDPNRFMGYEKEGYKIEITFPEFTCRCPRTSQPDFATIIVEYVPDKVCVELKSLKYFLNSFRDEGHFHEEVVNLIADDLRGVLDPINLYVEGRFNVRGGTYPIIRVGTRYRQGEEG